jgi:two-component system response regulator RegX3
MSRILIVEDEESFSDPLSYLLQKEGFVTAVAATGPEALAEFDANGADLVLLDLMLPGLSGTEVCRALRAKSSVPIIMLTAKDSEIDKVVGSGDGCRRLRHQALLGPGAACAGPGRAAPSRRGRRARGCARPGRTGADGRRPARRHGQRQGHVNAAQGVRTARTAPAARRSRAHPRPAHRPGVGERLRRGHQDPGRAREAAARQDRARPGQPALHILTVRGLGYKFEA